MPSHLPLLLNPLLNAIFNNPQPGKSHLKDVYSKLGRTWDDGTVIVIPPLHILLNYRDQESGIPYKELCYSPEFLEDHIITTKEHNGAKIFSTLNNKEILIKKDVLFTGKGFKKSLRLKVLKYDYFQNFNDYFEKGRKFLVMYIEGALIGTPVEHKTIELISPSNNKAELVTLEELEFESEEAKRPTQQEEIPTKVEDVKFEQVIRANPLISRSVGEQYENLFRSFSTKDALDTESLAKTFEQAIKLSSHIFQTLSSEIIDSIFQQSPNIDLNACVYDYVELNLYDKLWARLCDVNGDFLVHSYEILQHLSINQVSLPDKLKTNLNKINMLEQAVVKAINEFKKLTFTTDYRSKIAILVESINILSNIDSLTIDADTLVGLLLLVVIRSAVSHVECHLIYIQKFSLESIDLGMTGYSLSTLEAVLYFLKDASHMETLVKHSKDNREVFYHINNKELLELKKVADVYTYEPEHPLRSRTVNGESILTLAIQSNDYDTWKLLIDYEEVFPLEDILSDRTINGHGLFNAALNSENFEIIDDLAEILLNSCTALELKEYFNFKDFHDRTIGHYLFHYKELIRKIGLFIDWTSKDMNGQTPLFAICRSYDSPNYGQLIETVFEVVEEWYKINGSVFDYQDHIDVRGNTLLHILNSHIDVLLHYQRINVNEANERSLTPLMMYAKYNRIENIQRILKEQSLDIFKYDRNFFSCLDQSRNAQVSELIENEYLNKKIEPVDGKQIGVIRVKLEGTNWKLVIRGQIDGDKYEAHRGFSDFKELVRFLNIEFPNSFLPLNYTLGKFDLTLNIAGFNKLKLNQLLDSMNVLLQSLLINKSIANNELIWQFLRNSNFNTIELSQRSQSNLLSNKRKLLKIPDESNADSKAEKETFFLQPEEINEVNFFLKFSLKELSKFKHAFENLFKVANFQSLKDKETTDAFKLFGEENASLSKELRFVANTFSNLGKEFKFDEVLCGYTLHLSKSIEEFIGKINNLLNKKIFKWWKLYGELIELNDSYKKFKFVEQKKTNKHEDIAVDGLVQVNEVSFNEFTTNTTFNSTKDDGKKVKKAQPSFFTSFIESKRHKYEMKLQEGLKEVKSSLIELNKDIKFNHETLAMEMNNFIGYKTEFMKILMKKYIQKQISDLRFKNAVLKRDLEDLRALKFNGNR